MYDLSDSALGEGIWKPTYGELAASFSLVSSLSTPREAPLSARCVVKAPTKSGAALQPESQNHRMVGVGRDLCGSPSPTPCRSRVTYSRLHRTLSRRGWNISRAGDSTAPLGSLGQGHVTLRGKKFFLVFSWNFPGSSLCPLSIALSLGTTEKESGPILLIPTLEIFRGVYKVPSQPSLLQAEQAQLPQPLLVGEMLQSPHHPRIPLLDSLQ